MKNIHIYPLDAKAEPFVRHTEKTAHSVLEFFKKDVSLRIYFVPARQMAQINKRFRGKSGSTNILSFPEPASFPHPESIRSMVGEIYLDISRIADFYSKSGRRIPEKASVSLDHLIVHGILHLLGRRHENQSERKKMEGEEAKFLNSLLRDK